jgi:iron complex transport system ATP-binding protein
LKTDNTILEIKSLSIGYKESGILAGSINLNLTKGELTGLIGLNGIGKSTFLKTLLRLNAPISGNVFIEGKNIKSLSSNKLALLCSFVSTETVRVNEMTVYDLVSIGRYPFTGWNGKLQKTDKKLVEEAIESVGIWGLRNRKILQLSDGERQRASIARALAQDTPIIILDEPTAFLDIKNRYEIIHLLRNLTVEKAKSILFSSHDLGNVMQVADKLWIMDNGEIHEGSPEDMVIEGKIESVFSSEELVFNAETGIFTQRQNVGGKIQLIGSGHLFFWAKKAFERIGLSVSVEQERIKVEILSESENKFKLIAENKAFEEFKTIYNLISRIKRINL